MFMSIIMSWKEFLRKGSHQFEVVQTRADDMAMIQYTGGSTGVPKGVMLSSKNMNSYYANFLKANNAGLTAYKRCEYFLSGAPLFLAFGVSSCCHGPLSHSMELVLAPDPQPQSGIKLIKKYNVNHIVAGRLLIEGLVEHAKETQMDLSFVRSITYGGEAKNIIWEKKNEKTLQRNHLNTAILKFGL